MALVRTRIFSIVDAEFDRVFDGSLAIMTDPDTGTFPFAERELTTYDDQKAHIRSICEHFISKDNAFCFKTEDDGLLLTMIFGTVANSQLDMWVWLGADDANGSRSYVYDTANVLSFHTWLKEQGVTGIQSHISEKGNRLKDFTDDGNARIKDVSGDWGISETLEDYSDTVYSGRNVRTLTMNSNANIVVDDD
jgi:hypothetical protein|tara:strand:+ start:1644 stop:2222 length:579 start_codon:yes stop_codon:yes gene_type:complete